MGKKLLRGEGIKKGQDSMFRRKYRLPWRVRFSNSRSFSTLFFLAKIKPNNLLFNRFRIIISKKIDKRAVVRNRIKRLVSSVVEELSGNMKQGTDILFIIRKEAVGKTRKDFYLAIKEMFEKEGLIK